MNQIILRQQHFRDKSCAILHSTTKWAIKYNWQVILAQISALKCQMWHILSENVWACGWIHLIVITSPATGLGSKHDKLLSKIFFNSFPRHSCCCWRQSLYFCNNWLLQTMNMLIYLKFYSNELLHNIDCQNTFNRKIFRLWRLVQLLVKL